MKATMTLGRILVVDHESKSVHLLRQILMTAGYAVTVMNKGERAVQMAAEEPPNLILVEACLPGDEDGYDIVRRIRGFSDIPIILLSSLGAAEDVLRGFEAGADDYVTRPFDARVLLARIKAVLKRSQGQVSGPAEISFGGFVINLAARQVFQNGVEIYLTETEYDLLRELAMHRDQVMLHEQLLMSVWGPKYCEEVDYLRSYIHVLRRKLEIIPSQPRLIISRPGIGYMLVSATKGVA
jgi:two-component system KDP operon response regulator KdpE